MGDPENCSNKPIRNRWQPTATVPQRMVQRRSPHVGLRPRLRDCLREILGTVPPPPEDDALLFFKQWLAERNLGLVPIDNAASFEWPGRWLARVRATDPAPQVSVPSRLSIK